MPVVGFAPCAKWRWPPVWYHFSKLMIRTLPNAKKRKTIGEKYGNRNEVPVRGRGSQTYEP